MSIKRIRQALRDKFGDRKYRITKYGEIHVYGTMPNTDREGWYLFGYANGAQTIARIENLIEP